MPTACGHRWLNIQRGDHPRQIRYSDIPLPHLQSQQAIPLPFLGGWCYHGRLGAHHCSLGLLRLQTISRHIRLQVAFCTYHGLQTRVLRRGEYFWILQHLDRFDTPAHADAVALDVADDSSEEDWRFGHLRQRFCVSRYSLVRSLIASFKVLINSSVAAMAIVRQYKLYTTSVEDPSWSIVQIKIWM